MLSLVVYLALVAGVFLLSEKLSSSPIVSQYHTVNFPVLIPMWTFNWFRKSYHNGRVWNKLYFKKIHIFSLEYN